LRVTPASWRRGQIYRSIFCAMFVRGIDRLQIATTLAGQFLMLAR
jgi:hypothetical protein